MNSFARLFKYIWPQWQRILIVIICAFTVSALLSLSLVTIIPLLKVIMGEEGLNGWVNRKVANLRYGMEIYLPDKTDLAQSDISHYLLITKVKKGDIAEKSGLRKLDKIVGAGEFLITETPAKIPSDQLLNALAKASPQSLTIQLDRSDEAGKSNLVTLQIDLATAEKTALKTLFGRMKAKLIDYILFAAGFLPHDANASTKTKMIIYIILVALVVTIVRCTAKFYQDYLAQKTVQISINRLREDAVRHVMDMPIGFFTSERPSDTVSRLIRDTGEMGNGIKILLGKALREPLNAVFFMAWALLLNWQLTLIFLCSGPITVYSVARFGKQMKRATKKSLMAWSQMLAKLEEIISGLKIVKVYNREEHELRIIAAINKSLLKQLLKMSKVEAVSQPILEVLGMLAGSAALIAGAHWVQQGKLDGSEFLTLLALLGASAEAVRKTSDIWTKIQSADAAAIRVFAVMDNPLEPEKANAAELDRPKYKIEFKNVDFSYPNTREPALKKINLTVPIGSSVAVVGPNGSGKTTFANLIPRLYNPDRGCVLIDGTDIREFTLRSLRNQIGMVTQNVVTFNETIAANIAYGKAGAPMEEIISAAKRAYAHEFIELLPLGYETVIGEDGAGLSGGQLQRIIIARAILKNPPILIFDEAMSQIDSESESKIQAAIDEFMKGRTTFIIAHRFSTILNADLIVVLNDGRIVDSGKHSLLVESCQLYRGLYETQMIKA